MSEGQLQDGEDLNYLFGCKFDHFLDSDGNEIRDINVGTMGDDVVTQYLLGDKLRNQRVVMFGNPGAWRDPSRINDWDFHAQTIYDLGVDRIICHTTDHPHSVYSYAAHLGHTDIDWLADGNAFLAMRMGLLFDARSEYMGGCIWPYVMVIDNGIIEYYRQEPGLPMDDQTLWTDDFDRGDYATPLAVIEYLQG
jgi:peroxiredoxin